MTQIHVFSITHNPKNFQQSLSLALATLLIPQISQAATTSVDTNWTLPALALPLAGFILANGWTDAKNFGTAIGKFVLRTALGRRNRKGFLRDHPQAVNPSSRDVTKEFMDVYEAVSRGTDSATRIGDSPHAGTVPVAESVPLDQYSYLILPGYFSPRPPIYFEPTLQRMKEMGLDVRVVNEIPTTNTPETNAAIIKDLVLKSDKPVVLIGHSKGGVEALATVLMHPEAAQKTAFVIAIQAPFDGTPLADWAWEGAPLPLRLIARLIPGLKSLTTKERKAFLETWLPEILPVPMLTVSSSVEGQITPWVLGDFVIGRYAGQPSDGALSPANSQLPGVPHIHLRGVSHTELFKRSVTGQRQAMDPETFIEALLKFALGKGTVPAAEGTDTRRVSVPNSAAAGTVPRGPKVLGLGLPAILLAMGHWKLGILATVAVLGFISLTSSQKLYSLIARLYDLGLWINGYKRAVRHIVSQLPFDADANIRVLDAGCGTGLYSLAILKRFPNADVTAFDLNEEMAEKMRANLKKGGVEERATVITADMTKSLDNLKDSQFDLIVTGGVLEYVDQSVAVHNLSQYLKPNGYFLNAPTRNNFWGVLIGRSMRYKPYSQEENKKVFERQGFVLRQTTAPTWRHFPINLVKEAHLWQSIENP